MANGSIARPKSLGAEQKSSRRTIARTANVKNSNQQFVGDEDKKLPAEELLELGLNYLTQAIKSWETALDSIENAAYMQSQVLALPVIKKTFFYY